jgi:hypothetical protein
MPTHSERPADSGASTDVTAVPEQVDAAAGRDASAARRDLRATVRDRTAALRDQASEDHERAVGLTSTGNSSARATAAADRARATEDRASAAEDRVLAAADRRSATDDLESAKLTGGGLAVSSGDHARRLPPWQPADRDGPEINPAAASPTELSRSLTTLWTDYAGLAPSAVWTEIRGNVVTCVLTDAVADFNHSMITAQTDDTPRGVGQLDQLHYEREAVAAVGRLTHQRVASFLSSHDRDTDVATEVFTLGPLLTLDATAPPRPAASGEGLRLQRQIAMSRPSTLA